MYPTRRPLAAACAALWSIVAAAILAGCNTERLSPSPGLLQAPPRKVDLAALDPGLIVIASSPNAAEISADPPNRRVEPASEGAADATRSVLNTPSLGNPQLEAGVGVVQFALTPFAAAYGAINGTQQRLSPSEVTTAQLELAQAMKSNAVPEMLVQRVGDVARQKTRRLLVCTSGSSDAPSKDVPRCAVLEIAVSHLWLKVAKPGANQYTLSIGASARLVRASDGRVLLERSYHYESGPGWFIDWTRNGALAGVAKTGYQVLANQIAEDVFEPASQPPILIGPGQKQTRGASSIRALTRSTGSPARSEWSAHQNGPGVAKQWTLQLKPRRILTVSTHRHGISRPAGHPRRVLTRRVRNCAPIQSAASFQLVSLAQGETNSMEIHTSKTDERLRSPKPALEPGSNPGDRYDTEWAMDGLENDRNAVVQGVSCVVAVPFGLWEQTVGVIHQGSLERSEKLSRALNAVTTQQHFEGALADEVASNLQSKVVDPVRRTDEPMRFAFSNMTEGSGGGSAPANRATQYKTALEIQVLAPRFVGKHPNSSSRAMLVEVQVTVFRTSDGQELYSRPIQYRSSAKPLKDWAASDARLFRQELEACSQRTAQALVRDLIARGFVTPLQSTNSVVLDQRN